MACARRLACASPASRVVIRLVASGVRSGAARRRPLRALSNYGKARLSRYLSVVVWSSRSYQTYFAPPPAASPATAAATASGATPASPAARAPTHDRTAGRRRLQPRRSSPTRPPATSPSRPIHPRRCSPRQGAVLKNWQLQTLPDNRGSRWIWSRRFDARLDAAAVHACRQMIAALTATDGDGAVIGRARESCRSDQSRHAELRVSRQSRLERAQEFSVSTRRTSRTCSMSKPRSSRRHGEAGRRSNWGPASAWATPERIRDVSDRAALQSRDGKVERLTTGGSARSSPYEGPMRFAGVDDHYFLARRAARPTQPCSVDYQPVTVAGAGTTPQNRTRAFIACYADPHRAGSTAARAVLRRTEGVRHRCTRVDPELVRAIDFGMFACPRRAAAPGAQVDQRLPRQLRLVDRRAHDHHQPRDLPAAPSQHGVDEEDAGDPAGDEGDPGSLREVQRSPIPSARR